MSHECPGDDKRCDHCDLPGTPYEYQGRSFNGLHSYHGERICSLCLRFAYEKDIAELPEVGITPITGAYRFKRWCHKCRYHDCDPKNHEKRKR